jgi:tetratricopeptide (TPR) repeat protein
VAQVTTASLEALQAYSLGMKAWSTKGETIAVPLFQRAVELDPKFAMAYGRLGAAYDNIGEVALSAENTRKAYELRDRVSGRERLYIDSHYYDYATGQLEKSTEIYELWQQTYPQDLLPLDQLAGIDGVLGKYERALKEYREILRTEPNHEDIYSTLSSTYLSLNRLDEAQEMFKQAEERKLESVGLLAYRYELAFLRGDAREMERLVTAASAKPGEEDMLLSEQSDTDAYYGHLAKARDFSRRAVESARRADANERAALWLASAALREAEFGNATSASKGARAALAMGPGSIIAGLAALALARAGDTAQAEMHANKLNKDFPLHTVLQRYWLPAIRAAIELNHKSPSRSIEVLQSAAASELGQPGLLIQGTLYPVHVRGQAYLLAKQGKEAAAEFQKILDHRGIVLNFPLGALAHVGLARAYALQGETVKSRAAYQDFLALWKDADREIPILQEAKAEYAKLQ